jgi:multidrug resistance efflux pump
MEEIKKKLTPERIKKLTTIFMVMGALVVVVGFFMISFYLDLINYITTEDARITSDTTAVSSKIPGKVKAIMVQESDKVKKDQVIAQLDNSDLELALNQAKQNLVIAQIKQKQAGDALQLQTVGASSQTSQAHDGLQVVQEKLKQAKIAYDNAKDTLARNEALYKVGGISQVQYEQSRDDASVAQKNYIQAENQVETASAALDLASAGDKQSEIKAYDAKAADVAIKQAEVAVALAQSNYDNSFIKAPTDGVIGLKSVHQGETIASGQTLFSIVNPGKVWVAANIKETDIAKVKIGSKVNVFVDSEGGKKFAGEVFEIGNATNSTFSILPAMNTTGNYTKVTQLIPIKIKFVNTDKMFKIGTSVKIKVKI